ncbi:hypothetical protein JOB18_005080 [Solea senegalensis]|uniref:Uncharacterized protein n=1 Tax=Solea senegalensis TaxID=28829 RepID=A0AAV6SS35_SOLSE|nr:hypothetical protein JOB18_005080 [Solea senegalensis]
MRRPLDLPSLTLGPQLEHREKKRRLGAEEEHVVGDEELTSLCVWLRHSETIHPRYVATPLEFFKRKLHEYRKQESDEDTPPPTERAAPSYGLRAAFVRRIKLLCLSSGCHLGLSVASREDGERGGEAGNLLVEVKGALKAHGTPEAADR